MRWPRFTLLQLFLFTALIGLLAGWWTQSRQVGKQSRLTSLAISPDGTMVAANYSTGGFDVWDVSGNAPRKIRAFEPTRGLLHEVQFLDDGTIALVRFAGQGTELVRLDPKTKRETSLLRSPNPWHKWSVSLNGKVAASCSSPLTIDVWDLTTGKPIRQQTLPGGGFVERLQLDASGTLIATSIPAQSQIHVIDVVTGQVRVISSRMGPSVGTLAADGKSLIALDWPPPPSYGPEIMVVDLTEPAAQSHSQFTSDMFLRRVQVSRDGSRLLLSSYERMAVWDVAQHKRLWQFEKPITANPLWMDFSILLDQGAISLDGSRVVRSGGRDGIFVLDADTGQRLYTIGGMNRLAYVGGYSLGFIIWAVAWGLVSRREKLRQPAALPTPALPLLRFRALTPLQGLIISLGIIGLLCGLLVWLIHGITASWLRVVPGPGTFVTTFLAVFAVLFGYMYLKMRLWPLRASLRIAQSIVGNTGRRQRQGKVTGFFAGESTIEHTYLKHIDEIRQKLAGILGRDLQIKSELLVIGLERTDDYYLLNRTRLSHGGIVMTHLFAEECRVCEELAHRDGTTATVMLRATLALALLRRHWRIDAPVWLSAVVSAYLAADEHRPATLKRAHRMLLGILGDHALTMCREFLSMPLMERYKQIFQKDDPAILRELTLSQAIAVSLGEFLLGDRGGAQRDKMLEVIRSVGRKGNIDEALQRVFGHNAAGLIGPWWEWVQRQPLAPWEPPPEEARWAIAELTRSIGPASSLPLVEQQRKVTVLGAVCDLAAVPTLLAILENPEHPLRAEALWALRGISGEHWADDPARWRTWWQEVEPQMAAASTADRPPIAAQWTGGPWTDDVVKAELATAIQAAENPAADQPHEPWQLPAARALMGAGGVWGIVFTVAVSFYSGTIVMIPTLGIALLIGLLATSRAAGRHWWGLRTAAGLQIAAIVGCDPLQSVAGIAGAALLRTSAVRRYLQRVGGS